MMSQRNIYLLLIAFICLINEATAQYKDVLKVQWDADISTFQLENNAVAMPTCLGCNHFMEDKFLPKYIGNLKIGKGYSAKDVFIKVLSFTGEALNITDFNEEEYGPQSLSWSVKDDRGSSVIIYDFVPIARDARGVLRKIATYNLEFSQYRISKRGGGSSDFTNNSVLAMGEWYRIGLVEDGIYQLTMSDFEELGIDVANLEASSINVFGNGFGQLPFENSEFRPDDLLLNDIEFIGGGDNSFDEEDYILFFGKGPHKWTYNEDDELFDHQKHDYVDTSYYFIGINTGVAPGRISNLSSSGSTPNQQVISFNDYVFHEVDRENMLKSGREWYGEKFDVQTNYAFTGPDYTFPNIIADSESVIRANVISRTTVSGSCRFELNTNGVQDFELISSTGIQVTSAFARVRNLEVRLETNNPALNTSIIYTKNVPSASGWLNWLDMNVRRELKMNGSQMIFRDALSVGPGNVSQFRLSNESAANEIWEVTNPSKPKRVQGVRESDTFTYTLPTDDLREFIAFSSNYYSPNLVGSVKNQNLHALGLNEQIDMIIVSPSQFLAKAEELADIHRSFELDPLNVQVVAINEIYNEFSSGMRDVTAIKWFMKMFYERSAGVPENMPRYLMLFGDGSFDNKNFTVGNTNFIPTFQSLNSLIPADSFVSDDYFGFLSDDEGEGNLDVMDLGIGRLVVKNNSEATSVINKIRSYIEIQTQDFNSDCTVCGDNSSNFGAWRNVITLIADDEDNNSHMSNSRIIGDQINGYTKDYNLERVFIDAFPEVATPGGSRYPDVNKAINRRVENGAFIINYIGHGGETGWAHERILDVPTILDWSNGSQLPIFVTATCEFTRFDDPLRTSAGEFVLLNGNGGGIALLTTTRLVYSGPNFTLNRRFYDALFNRPANEVVVRLGDVSRETKNNSLASSSSNHRNFSLIGDPALPLALPKHKVKITALTDTMGNPIDTLKALGVARVIGQVTSQSGSLLTGFDGRLNAIVFDRVEQKTTLANDGGNVFSYPAQENIVYRGNAEVKNGQFVFDFVIPKDISFAVDTTARISLYAIGETTDATGYKENIRIGDRDENAIDDGAGPNLNIFLNDENFVHGGYTNETPVFLANVFDDNGINTVGSGIGHDISVVLDNNTSETILLNDYYESDLNTYKSGKVQYQFDDLSPGPHHLKFKVWDVHNNSNEAELEFIVAESEEFSIERVLNYPNPFTTHTDFYFEHNQSCEYLNVLIQIYTVSGKLAKSINTVSNTDGFRNEAISWNGKDDFGDKLATGVYVYKISVRNPAGDQVEKFEKLVILN